jgi:hypothetical protein
MNHPSKIRIIEPFIILVLFVVLAVYLLNVFNTGNWFWFLNSAANTRPTHIVILNDGERINLERGQPEFETLADAVESSLSRLNNTDLVAVGLSEETLDDYATDSLVLELHFDQPVTFNTIARVGEPTQLLIPIRGRHAEANYVFLGAQGEWWAGAVRMADSSPLLTALEELGYDVPESEPAGSF